MPPVEHACDGRRGLLAGQLGRAAIGMGMLVFGAVVPVIGFRIEVGASRAIIERLIPRHDGAQTGPYR